MRGHPTLNKIGVEKATRGTETSKYPEEEKETSIPQVAASEQGRAQTEAGDRSGVAGRPQAGACIAEEAWKGLAERARPP